MSDKHAVRLSLIDAENALRSALGAADSVIVIHAVALAQQAVDLAMEITRKSFDDGGQ